MDLKSMLTSDAKDTKEFWPLNKADILYAIPEAGIEELQRQYDWWFTKMLNLGPVSCMDGSIQIFHFCNKNFPLPSTTLCVTFAFSSLYKPRELLPCCKLRKKHIQWVPVLHSYEPFAMKTMTWFTPMCICIKKCYMEDEDYRLLIRGYAIYERARRFGYGTLDALAFWPVPVDETFERNVTINE